MSEHHTLPDHIGPRQVAHLAWPIVISMLSYTAMTVADAIFVGQLGTIELAAIGISGTLTWLLLAFGNGLLRGVKIEVAQHTGAGEHVLTRRYIWAGLQLAAISGLCVVALIPAGPALFDILGTTPELHEPASVYFAIRLLGAPLMYTSGALSAWFQGRGDMRTPMISSLLANGLNIALDVVLIFGLGPIPAYGMAGAAIATDISLAAGAAYLVWQIRHELAGVPARFERALLARIVRVGAPVGVSWTLEVGSWTVFVTILSSVGAADLAAHVLVCRLISMSFLPGHAIGEAAGVLVGQCIGARRYADALDAYRAARILGVGLMAAFATLFLLAPEPLIAIFGATGEVSTLAAQLLAIAALMQVFDALTMVSQGAISGAGDTRYVMLINVATSWGFLLPIGYLLAIHAQLGAIGAWTALALQLFLLAILSMARIRSGRWLVAHTGEEPPKERRATTTTAAEV